MRQIITTVVRDLCFLASFSFGCMSCSQTPDKERIIEDYDYFFEQLESIHPDPYTVYGGKEIFSQRVDSLREALFQFHALDADRMQTEVSRFLIPLHDGHTYCGYSNYYTNEEPRYLPVNLFPMSSGLFIWSSTEEYEWMLGSKINEIGGLTVDQLIDRLSLITSAENRYGLYNQLEESRLASPLLAMLLDDFDGQSLQMQVTTAAEVDTTLVMPMYLAEEINAMTSKSTGVDPRFPSRNFEYRWADRDRGVMAFRCTRIISRDCLTIMRDNGMEYQSTLEWAWGDTPLDSVPTIASQFGAMLLEMMEAQAQHLIIDLRANGGGWTPILYATLYQLFGDEYLTKDFNISFDTKISEGYLKKNNTTLEAFNAARGTNYQLDDFVHVTDGDGVREINDSIRTRIINGYDCLEKEMLHKQNGEPLYRPKHIYVVTDQGTFSAAFHYAFMLWKMGATIVGVPSSQAPNTYMEVTDFTLPNSGLHCSVSNSIQRFLPDNDPRAKVLWPDWMLTYDDYRQYGFDSRSSLIYILDHLLP